MHISRRTFMGGCAGLGVASGMQLAWAPEAKAAGNQHLIIYLFLRGGMDGLNFVCPISGATRANYEGHRPYIQIPLPGQTNGAIALADGWGLNPRACVRLDGSGNKQYNGAFKKLWDDGDLAIVHGTGMPPGYSTRSHFDAQEHIERGITENSPTNPFDGWLARYLESQNIPASALIPAVSTDGRPVDSLSGFLRTSAVDSLDDFHWLSNDGLRNPDDTSMREHFLTMMKSVYSNTDPLGKAALHANEMIDVVDAAVKADSGLTPHAGYPRNSRDDLLSLGSDLHDITRLLHSSLDFGLRVATINVGGWDTHRQQEYQYAGNFGGKVETLTRSIAAFVAETKALGMGDRYTMIVQSEFGRRVRENADRGTDHGTGNVMFVIGQNVRGGQFYGTAPSLRSGELFGGEDVPVTTDYRHVIGEVLQDKANVTPAALSGILPGYSVPQRMGLFQDEPPLGTIFTSGFE